LEGEEHFTESKKVDSHKKTLTFKEEAEIFRLPVEFVETDWDLIREAAMIKSQYPMAFADCFAAAVAQHTDALIMTGDPEFKLIEDQVKIQWINK